MPMKADNVADKPEILDDTVPAIPKPAKEEPVLQYNRMVSTPVDNSYDAVQAPLPPIKPAEPAPAAVTAHATFPTFIEVANKVRDHHFRPKRIILTILALLVGVILFFSGYGLAQYRAQKSCDSSQGGLPTLDSSSSSSCGNPCSSYSCSVADEPVIYLYPTHKEPVNVDISYVTGLSRTEPVYDSATGWQVVADPDGTLKNTADGKTYPYLIWEGNPAPLRYDMSKGFVVIGKDTRAFLQHQLSVMGLNQSEINSFIDYWAPSLEKNPYNLLHFAGDDYTSLAPLHISPKPDSLLRIFMAYKPLQAPVYVSPQTFPTFHRSGFTAVEWGGTELHDKN